MTAVRHEREIVLAVQDLQVRFSVGKETTTAVDGVSYDLAKGETLGVVGESGSGKSVTLLAALGLLPSPPAHVTRGQVVIRGENVFEMKEEDFRRIRGKEVGFVFQDPFNALNPVMRIGDQIAEAQAVHGASWKSARRDAVRLLELVGVPDARNRSDQYPHEFSGGMLQRVVIAVAIANSPLILVADEPTTALDVTVQAQVLDVLKKAQLETGAATILVTHDLGVISQMATRAVVMYAGRVMEEAAVDSLYEDPLHPYTLGLLGCSPANHKSTVDLSPIPGQPPDPLDMPEGCPFHPRCRFKQDVCVTAKPETRTLPDGRRVACHFAPELHLNQYLSVAVR